MELSWRTALILLGLAAVVWVVFDGLKRMRRARAESLRLDVDPGFVSARDDFENPELPSGSWRTVRPAIHTQTPQMSTPLVFEDDPLPNALGNDDRHEDPEPNFNLEPVTELNETPEILVAPEKIAAPSTPTVAVRPVNLDEQVPVLLDVEELGDNTSELPSFVAAESPPVTAESCVSETAEAEISEAVEPEVQAEPVASLVTEIDTAGTAPTAALDAKTLTSPVNFAHPDAEKLSDRPAADMTLVIHCIARKGQEFAGKDVLYLFNSCDLRFGERDIFHRFEAADGRGFIQFSVVHSFAPQTFTPQQMAQQSFGGFSFFMKLPGPKMSLQAYEAMLGMAKVFEERFNAELFDGDRSALTQQTIEHDRQQIIEYERRQHLAEKKRMRG